MANNYFSKAKEIDNSITLFPWALDSKSDKIKNAWSILEQVGSFKTFFHKAQPKISLVVMSMCKSDSSTTGSQQSPFIKTSSGG